MRAQINNISTSAVFVGASMFLFIIFATSLLAGEFVAAGHVNEPNGSNHNVHGIIAADKKKENTDILKSDHHVVLPQQEKPSQPEAVNSSAADASTAIVQPLLNLKKENEKFVKLLYEPLQKECDSSLFEDAFSEEKKRLCDTMRKLKLNVPSLKKFESDQQQFASKLSRIRETILSYAHKFRMKYSTLTDKELKKEILLNIRENTSKELILKYTESYDEFIGGKNEAATVYKLLLIGRKVAEKFNQTNVEDAAKQALAYQLFAISLTIHSNLIGPTKSKDGQVHDIREIAQKWHQMLAAAQKLKEENENFAKLIYEPLKEECEQNRFSHAFSEDKKSLCGTMGKLNLSVPHLKTAHAELNEREIALLSEKIRDAIHEDVQELSKKYFRMLYKMVDYQSDTLADEITAKVGKICHEKLFSEFKSNYDAFVKEKTNVVTVFKLLKIGQQMAKMFKTGEEWEQQALAYQQLAINLTIHSIHIDPTKSKDGQTHNIRTIAENWPVQLGKLADSATAIVQILMDLKKENKKFLTLLLEPLKKECDTNPSGDESLCDTVKFLKNQLLILKTKPNETYSEAICKLIHSDADELWNKYRYHNLLGDTLREQIFETVHAMADYELISKYKESYEEFMGEEKKDAAKKDAAKGGEENTVDPKSHQQIVFELLHIGKTVAEMFQKTNVKKEKQQTLAYQQFAINLTIHSIHSGDPKQKIRAIAEQWPMQWEKLTP